MVWGLPPQQRGPVTASELHPRVATQATFLSGEVLCQPGGGPWEALAFGERTGTRPPTRCRVLVLGKEPGARTCVPWLRGQAALVRIGDAVPV